MVISIPSYIAAFFFVGMYSPCLIILFLTNMKFLLLISAGFLLCAIHSCTRTQQNANPIFATGKILGKVSLDLEEASGLVASIANPKHLWSLNDSGNPSDLYLINNQGEVVMKCKLKGIKNRDWESITSGRDPQSGVNYIYIGETGDNEAKYSLKFLYRIQEPLITKEDEIWIDEVEMLIIRLPDGPRDMEAIATDHVSGDLYLISKREENVSVYILPQDQLIAGDTLIPEKIGTLPYHNVVAADFSLDGKELLIKTYDEIFYWNKSDSITVREMLMQKPDVLNYRPEPQGESIAWALDGSGFYTLSESVDNERAKLYFYKRN